MPAHARAFPPGYVPGRPEDTVLYGIVRAHLPDLLEHVNAEYASPLPRYVLDELRGYLACGRFENGFLRCRCDGCGHDMLVAFSCKRRGVCPSCAARRMCNEAAHLTDRVLPNVPVRQWVLSLPFALRRAAAFRADVLTALSGMFVAEIFRTMRTRGDGSEAGAITFVQRFGGSLNLNVHFHVLVLDGTFVRRADGVSFRDAPPPSSDVLARVARRVHDRAVRWLRRRGLLDEREPEDRSDACEETPLDACARVAMSRGGLTDERGARGADNPVDSIEAPAPKRFSARYEGFDVHAAVRIDANDDEGRERLVRYCARPAFALERLSLTREGMVSYRVKQSRGIRTHRLMTPVEFLARLVALVPPPRYPLVRYHGVLAPHSAWRKHVVPKRPAELRLARIQCSAGREAAESSRPKSSRGDARRGERPRVAAQGTTVDLVQSPRLTSPRADARPDVEVAHDVITVRHWGRLVDGALLATSPRVPWADLLRRTHGVDALVCPRCDGRLRVLAAITAPETAGAILRALGVDDSVAPTRSPVPRARAPTAQLELRFAGDQAGES